MQKKNNIMIYHICLVYEIVLICLNQNPRGILEKKPHAMRLTVVRIESYVKTIFKEDMYIDKFIYCYCGLL